jgi:hypothetical protein
MGLLPGYTAGFERMTEAETESTPSPARPRVLSPRSVRTLYNVADALFPGGGAGPEGGAVDVAPEVVRRLLHRGPGAARRAWFWLAVTEWAPVLGLRSRKSFSRLPRERRRELLERALSGGPAARRRALEQLRDWIGAALRDPAQSSEGA